MVERRFAHVADYAHECRESSRTKASVPFEIKAEGSGFPIRGATADLTLERLLHRKFVSICIGD